MFQTVFSACFSIVPWVIVNRLFCSAKQSATVCYLPVHPSSLGPNSLYTLTLLYYCLLPIPPFAFTEAPISLLFLELVGSAGPVLFAALSQKVGCIAVHWLTISTWPLDAGFSLPIYNKVPKAKERGVVFFFFKWADPFYPIYNEVESSFFAKKVFLHIFTQ